ncbi:uncharacterized protein B0P05DRAFT_544106 [Gilbertella persicaria]|uniref:uncharacterized protein n=1 Tax=Gilbertella persicaria TaxID=101096 RepID=UPI00221F0A87|nr:uncharacterized protein B0P05DRAFT_544106 [Gilbertella persicaria]KAI8078093.1 hypothetical protein B0P05DRAFT_544106 [Gilbertella persicaria]
MMFIELIPERIIVGCVVVLITPMNLFLISLYVNYYFACTIKPGYTPEGWVSQISFFICDTNQVQYLEPPHAIIESIDDDLLKSGITGLPLKPPRAHHCRHCGQCVLRFANYSYFVRFVFSVMICCSYGCFLLLWRLQLFKIIHPSMLELVIVVFNIILIFFVLLLVGQTTIEGSERTKTTQLIRRQKIDAATIKICSVLGSNPIFWMWPQGTPGNGLQYAVKPNTDPRVVYELDPYSQTEETTTKLVRRDSEGYLVREITMEDRMHMLHHHLEDQGFIEAYSDDEEFDKKNK